MSEKIDSAQLREWMNVMCENTAEDAPAVINAVAEQPMDIREAFLRAMEDDIKRLVLMHRIAVQRLSPRTNNNRSDNHAAVRRSNELIRKAKLQVRALARLA